MVRVCAPFSTKFNTILESNPPKVAQAHSETVLKVTINSSGGFRTSEQLRQPVPAFTQSSQSPSQSSPSDCPSWHVPLSLQQVLPVILIDADTLPNFELHWNGSSSDVEKALIVKFSPQQSPDVSALMIHPLPESLQSKIHAPDDKYSSVHVSVPDVAFHIALVSHALLSKVRVGLFFVALVGHVPPTPPEYDNVNVAVLSSLKQQPLTGPQHAAGPSALDELLDELELELLDELELDELELELLELLDELELDELLDELELLDDELDDELELELLDELELLELLDELDDELLDDELVLELELELVLELEDDEDELSQKS